jgi:hypothetical protein
MVASSVVQKYRMPKWEEMKRKDIVGWTDVMVSGSVGLSDGVKTTNSEVFAAESSAPDEPTVHRMKRRINCVNGHVQWRATASSTGWTDAWKSIASDHPTVLLSPAFTQQLVRCLGLFIPLYSSIWGCSIVWKCRRVQDTKNIISNPSKCEIAHP